MEFIRKYAMQIIAVLLTICVVQSAVLVSVQSGSKATSALDQPAVEQIEAGEQNEPSLEEEPVQEPQPEPEIEPEPVWIPAKEILSGSNIIAHGMGKIEGVTVLNCLESFKEQYDRGVRVFEVDLRVTSDLQVVLRHDWRAGWQEGVSELSIPTLEEFKAKPLLGKYTPMTFRDLLLLMKEYPDICIVTDTKFVDEELVTIQFKAMLRDAAELGMNNIFDRIVVQVYTELMFKVVDNIGDFPNYIYTLYKTGFNQTVEAFENVAAFCKENGIDGVTMWYYWWHDEFAPVAQANDLAVYVHTVNDVEAAAGFVLRGVRGVYTDEIAPDDLEAAIAASLPVAETEGEGA